MAIENANQAAGHLMPAGLLDFSVRETVLETATPAFLLAGKTLSGAAAGRVLWSSHAAARRLGARDGAELMRIGLPTLSPGALRLATLAEQVSPETPRRLERLRFNIGFRSQILTAMCQPVALANGESGLLVALLDAAISVNDAYLAPVDAAADPAADQLPGFTRRHDDMPGELLSGNKLAGEPASEASLPDAQALRSAPAWVARPEGERKPLRFVFALDANGVVDHVTPPLAEAVGPENAEILGQPLAAVVQSFDPVAAEAIRSAILAGETWSSIRVAWPVARTDLVIPVDLSALPLIDSEEGLKGFSGFGRCHLERASTVVASPSAREDVTSDDPQISPDDPQVLPDPLAAIAPPAVEDADLTSALAAFNEPDPPQDENLPTPPALKVVPPTEPETAPVVAAPGNVVSLRVGQPDFSAPAQGRNGLSMAERNAFREIARALGAKFDEGSTPEPALPASTSRADAGAPCGPEEAADTEDFPADMELPSANPAQTGEAGTADAGILSLHIFDQLPVGILVMREDVPLFANRTLLDLTDYPDFAAFAAEDGARAIFRKSTMPRDRDTGFDTVVLTTREGELVPVDAHLQPTVWAGSKATLISMRRAVELEQGKALRSVALDLKRIRAEAQELRAVLDTATDGVVTLDEAGKILSINGAAEALFGLNQNEVVGGSFTTLLSNDSHADALDYFEGLRANGVRSVLNDGRDVFGREKKGGRIPLFMTLGRISDDEPKRYCAVLRDLTAWKRAEGELTEARRNAELASAKKSDFLTKISHEIRTPMNAIIGFAEVMSEERLGPIDNPKYKEYLGDIRSSGKHVVSLVNDLLDLAKIEAGRMEMRFAATDLNAIVASSVGIIQPQANQNRVLVRTQLAQKLPPVVADERSIRQIILNMLSNATRFTESGGQVIVATALLESGEAVIRIRDTGVGMSAVEIEHALEPFRQVGTRRDHGGTGLGLPLTKALVEANRASFAIRSTPGEGTMVEITFPSTRVLAE